MNQGPDHSAISTEEAFTLWQEGEHIVEHPWYQQRRDDYERAIAATLARLSAHTTVRELVAGYFADELDDAFAEMVIRCADGRILDWQRVEDAAYWRRFQALLRTQGMASSERQLPDAAAGPPRQQQSVRRRRLDTRWQLTALVVAVVVALGSVLLARTGLLATNTPASSSVVPASWHTFRDTWGLYTLRFAPQWTAGGGTDTYGGACGQAVCDHEGFTFLDPAQGAGTASVHIDVFPLMSPDRRAACMPYSGITGTPFAGLPTRLDGCGDWAVATQNDVFIFSVVIPGVSGQHLEGPNPSTPTPVPSSWQATDKVDVQGLLATFQFVGHPQPLAS